MRAVATLILVVTSIFVVSSLSNAWCQSPAESDPSSQEKPVSFWMEKKMDYAQAILRGLAASDFESIGEGARQMRLLNKVEGFVRKRNPSYQRELITFEHACDEMIRQSDQQNVQGVALAFNQLTISCVSCHQSLRSRATAGDSPAGSAESTTSEKDK